MSALVSALTARAFRTVGPAEANVAIAEVRDTLEAQLGSAFSYELFVPRANVDDFFLQTALPKLVNFLHGRGARSSAPGVFVSLFTAEGLHFIEADVVLEILAAQKHVPVSELFRRYADGGVGDPKLLGG